MQERSAFSGGDQQYLRDVQYGSGAKLDARSSLHRTFATSPIPLAHFEAALIDWSEVRSVLECGCGTGRFWDNDGLPRSLTVTLTDLSPGMVAEALARAQQGGYAQITGRACDVQALPFDDESFDVVIANHMLYHVPDPDRGVAELARVVRREGVVLAATNGYGHMREINDAIAEVFGAHGESLYEVFGIDTGEARLREQFATVVWHAFDNDLLVDDPGAVVAYGLSFPPGEFATDTQKDQFAHAVARRFDGPLLRIRTRAGVFVCSNPRRSLSMNLPDAHSSPEPAARDAVSAGTEPARPVVRVMRPDEFDDVCDLSVAAFGGRAEIRELMELLHSSWAWDPQLSFVAEVDGVLVGHVLYSHAFLDAPTRLVDVLVLSPVAVRPDRQNRSIGTALITESLRILSNRPEPLVFLEGHPSFYPRFGFREATKLGFTAPSVRIPPAAFMVHPLPRYEQWMTGALVYPDAFWRADAVGLRD